MLADMFFFDVLTTLSWDTIYPDRPEKYEMLTSGPKFKDVRKPKCPFDINYNNVWYLNPQIT